MVTGEMDNGKKAGRRKTAPAVKVAPSGFVSEREQIVAMYAPECIPSQELRRVGSRDVPIGAFTNEFTAYFGDPNVSVDHYKALGYEPVIANGRHVSHKRDLLYRRPVGEFVKHMADSERQSEEVVDQAMRGQDDIALDAGLRVVPDPI